ACRHSLDDTRRLVDSGHREDAPLAGDPLQLVRTTVDQLQPGSCHEVTHCLGHEYLSATRQGTDSGPDVDGQSSEAAAWRHLKLAGVQSGTYGQPERRHRSDDRLSAADGSRRSVEPGEEAVAGRLDLLAPEPDQLPPDRGVMELDEVTPPCIADLDQAIRAADDVGE